MNGGTTLLPKSECRRMERNFRMNCETFLKVCHDLRRSLEGQATRMRMPLSVEKQVAVTLYYLADEGRMRKVDNAFGIGKSTVSKVSSSLFLGSLVRSTLNIPRP